MWTGRPQLGRSTRLDCQSKSRAQNHATVPEQVVRRERDAPHGLRTYVHIGTGNYNPSTAAVYTDLGLLSCNPALCNDVVDIFKHLTGADAATA